MQFRTGRSRHDEERILPLINVVFLLLVFFMLAGRLSASDPFPVAPPRSASGSPADPQGLTVHVGADGRLALDGEIMGEAALRATVAERLAADDGTRVRLKADGHAEAQGVVAVLELLRAAGVTDLTLLTVPGGR